MSTLAAERVLLGWRGVVRYCLQRESCLNAKEVGLLHTLTEWIGQPTEAQAHWLKMIAASVEGVDPDQDDEPAADLDAAHDAYLRSDAWQRIRRLTLARAGYECAQCGNKRGLHVHHMSYEHFGDELSHPEDLKVLCKGCHDLTHGITP